MDINILPCEFGEQDVRILVSNDDGISAPGIELLTQAAQRLAADVWVIAPDGNRSGASHALTLRRTVRLTRLAERRYSCTGTPADCVVAAFTWLFAEAERPTLVLSGINEGVNVAEDVAYSGTMAIAREAVFWGIPAISISRPKGLGGYDNSQLAWFAATLGYLWEQRERWTGEGHWLNLNLPASIPAPLREARLGRDKIARRSKVVATTDGYTDLQITSARLGARSDGDENHLIATGYACVTNLAWHGFSALPERFCEELAVKSD